MFGFSSRRVHSFINKLIKQKTIGFNLSGNRKVSDKIKIVKQWKEIPGPSSMPVLGQMRHFLPQGELHNLQGHVLLNTLYKKYGDIVRIEAMFGKPPFLFLFEPKSIAEIIRGEDWYPRRPILPTLEYYRTEHKQQKDRQIGLMADHGEGWRQFRSIVNPVLLQSKIIKLYETVINNIAEEMIQRLKSKIDENNMIKDDLFFEFNLWALESTGFVALGCRLNCLDPNLPPESPAYQLVQCADDLFTKFDSLNSGINLWRYFPTKLFREAMVTFETQERLSKVFIEKAIRQSSQTRKDNEKGILEKLLEVDEEVAHVMAVDMLIAGVDTVANTILAGLYLLAVNPEKQARLREEIKTGNNGKKYLKACIKETLRMKPIVTSIMRQINKDYILLGYNIPKDTVVIFGHHVLSMSDEQFPRAQEFLPERWIVEKGHPLHHGQADPLVYNPFGFGARSCIGKRIAELEMESLMTKLMTNFKIEWFGPPIQHEHNFLYKVAPPFNFKFIRI